MRLFIAVWPSDEVSARIAALPRPEQPGLRWTTPEQWHVTLRFLGSVDDPERVKGALGGLDRSGPVTAVAGPAVGRMGRAILCLPVAGLDGVAGAVVRATAGLGQPPPDRPFLGHLTLARAKPGVDLRPLAGAALSEAWPVSAVTLVASQTHPQGARYRVMASVPLA